MADKLTEEQQKAFDASVAVAVDKILASKLIEARLDTLEEAIDAVNKKADDAADSIIVDAKPKKAAAPVEFEIGKKTYRAKGNTYKVINKSGGTDVVDLVGLKTAELKAAFEASPSMFEEV